MPSVISASVGIVVIVDVKCLTMYEDSRSTMCSVFLVSSLDGKYVASSAIEFVHDVKD